MTTLNEQQPVNTLAPFKTTSAEIDALTIEQVTFADGSTMTTAASSGPFPSDVDCGTF